MRKCFHEVFRPTLHIPYINGTYIGVARGAGGLGLSNIFRIGLSSHFVL